MKKRSTHSKWLLGVVAINIVLSWWGLYKLGTDNLHMPPLFAAVISAAFDMAVLGLAKQSLRHAKARESAFMPNLATFAIVGLSSYANGAHAQLAHYPTVGIVIFAAFPVLALILFEIDLRFIARQAERVEGARSAPMPKFEFLQWFFYRRAAWRGFKLAVLDRSLSPSQALRLGIRWCQVDNPDYGIPVEVADALHSEILTSTAVPLRGSEPAATLPTAATINTAAGLYVLVPADQAANLPQPAATAPEPAATVLQPAATAPEPAATAPEPAAVVNLPHGVSAATAQPQVKRGESAARRGSVTARRRQPAASVTSITREAAAQVGLDPANVLPIVAARLGKLPNRSTVERELRRLRAAGGDDTIGAYL